MQKNGTSQLSKIGASAAIFFEERLLLVKRNRGAYKGLWSLPGGHSEENETPEQTAHREIQEETGLSVNIRGLVTTLSIKPDENTLYELHIFWGTTENNIAKASDDADEIIWTTLPDIDNLQTTPDLKKVAGIAYNSYRKSQKFQNK